MPWPGYDAGMKNKTERLGDWLEWRRIVSEYPVLDQTFSAPEPFDPGGGFAKSSGIVPYDSVQALLARRRARLKRLADAAMNSNSGNSNSGNSHS